MWAQVLSRFARSEGWALWGLVSAWEFWGMFRGFWGKLREECGFILGFWAGFEVKRCSRDAAREKSRPRRCWWLARSARRKGTCKSGLGIETRSPLKPRLFARLSSASPHFLPRLQRHLAKSLRVVRTMRQNSARFARSAVRVHWSVSRRESTFRTLRNVFSRLESTFRTVRSLFALQDPCQ